MAQTTFVIFLPLSLRSRSILVTYDRVTPRILAASTTGTALRGLLFI